MLRLFVGFLSALSLSLPVLAGEPDVNQIKAGLIRTFPELHASTVKPSSVPGMFEVEFDSKILYVTADGKFLFMGDVVDLKSQTNLTEGRRAEVRNQLLSKVGVENMIVIGPEKPKRTLTVFTDVDCGYCAAFHRDVPALIKEGVQVRYLFFPRAGINSDSYRRSVAVWCADDRAKAIGIAKAGGKLDMKTCPNPVKNNYELGQRLDVTGTPTIFLDNGKVYPGYIPAQRLLSMLGLKS